MATSYKSTKKSAGKGGASKKSASKKSGASARAATGGGPLPPYGVAIREASARGDVAEMRRVAASARKWIKDAQAALEKLEGRIEKVGGRK
ncbi:MAG TPA: DUF1843 domain-containing protein [Pyrinomonadaceae bacterium]|jgi:hypothetical protein|nr:DUF1843 domain-containing protein [Pyrinomonadaceae bacterium]